MPDSPRWTATCRRDGSAWSVHVAELGATGRAALLSRVADVARELVRASGRVQEGERTLHVAVHQSLAAAGLLHDQSRPLEHGDVLLDGGEGHRVAGGEAGDGDVLCEHPRQDVASGRVGQGGEDAVLAAPVQLIYNHLVVG